MIFSIGKCIRDDRIKLDYLIRNEYTLGITTAAHHRDIITGNKNL